MVGSKLSIGSRLGAGFAMIAALAFGASALGLMQLNGIGAQFTRIVEVNNPKGDKVRFTAERLDGAIVVTTLQPAN